MLDIRTNQSSTDSRRGQCLQEGMPAVSPANSTHAGALSDKAESLLRKQNTGPFAANDLTTWRLSLSASLCQPHVQQCTSPPATKCKPHHGLVTPVASLALTYKDISHTTISTKGVHYGCVSPAGLLVAPIQALHHIAQALTMWHHTCTHPWMHAAHPSRHAAAADGSQHTTMSTAT